jgi:serine/threonine-protein kinase
VLYELFTGKRAFEASSKTELQQMQQSATPPSLSSQIGGVDDAIERTVLRCLDFDPRKRPESALAVSAALPGGDPLAAALAAGETPSPEMVADAGEEGALRPWVAIALLAIALIGVSLDFGYRTRNSTLARIGLPEPAPVLRLRAQQILEQLGHDEPAADSTWGLSSDGAYYRWVESTDHSPDRWSALETVIPRPYYLWYRQSPEWLPVRGFQLSTWWKYPPSTEPGTADLRLDAEGRLVELRIIPPIVSTDRESDSDFAWEEVLALTGIDQLSLEVIEPAANPPLNCSAQSAWTGLYPDQAEIPIRIEACLVDERLVYLEVLPPWNAKVAALAEESFGSQRAELQRRVSRFGVPILASLFLGILTGGLLLARRNLRLRRADRRGAARLATFLFIAELLTNLLSSHFGPPDETFRLLLQCLAQAIYVAALGWALYVGIEPFIRRVWPQSMIAYQRLLSGRLRDPLIGRDILIGAALSVTTILGRIGFHLTAEEAELVTGGDLIFISGLKRWATEMMGFTQILPPLILMTLIVLLRIVVRRDWLTALLPTLFMVSLLTFVNAEPINAIWFFCIWAPVFFMAVRFGLVALTAGFLFAGIDALIRVWDPSSWYFPYVAAGLLLFLLPLLYALAELLDG